MFLEDLKDKCLLVYNFLFECVFVSCSSLHVLLIQGRDRKIVETSGNLPKYWKKEDHPYRKDEKLSFLNGLEQIRQFSKNLTKPKEIPYNEGRVIAMLIVIDKKHNNIYQRRQVALFC